MRILIVKLSSIGDVVHTLPAAAMLRRAYPHAHIAWVVESRASAILEDCPVIDELIEINTRAWRKRFFSNSTIGEIRLSLKNIRGMGDDSGRSGPIDLAIDFQGLIKSGLITFASGARRRFGFETTELREKASRFFLTEQVRTTHCRHVIDKNLELVRAYISRQVLTDQSEALGPDRPSPYEFPIKVSDKDEQYVEEAISNHSSRFAIINPGGGWPTKIWPPERYAQIADWLWSEYALKSFITYGPGERLLARSVEAASRSGASRLFASTLKQFVALSRRAEVFIGGDTGPLHLAAACGTRVVGIYGPTTAERNGPFDKQDVTVGRDLWCRTDCHRRSCWHWECMDIPVIELQRALSLRLSESPAFRV